MPLPSDLFHQEPFFRRQTLKVFIKYKGETYLGASLVNTRLGSGLRGMRVSTVLMETMSKIELRVLLR